RSAQQSLSFCCLGATGNLGKFTDARLNLGYGNGGDAEAHVRTWQRRFVEEAGPRRNDDAARGSLTAQMLRIGAGRALHPEPGGTWNIVGLPLRHVTGDRGKQRPAALIKGGRDTPHQRVVVAQRQEECKDRKSVV